jgi:methionine synthase II (cobalamin-independent)
MSFNPRCLATAIGSFPHEDPEAACDLIFRSIPDIPTWPQLPRVDFREGMEIQYSEGLPRVVIDQESERMYFDTSGDTAGELAGFYEDYLAGNIEHFKISPEFSRGVYAMESRFKQADRPHPEYFKSHVTGPLTMGLGRVDENKRAIYYNDVFRDVIVKATEMKARWLLRRFKFLSSRQICFVDEPILSAFGSSTYVSVERADVVRCLSEVFKAIHDEGALAGAHCCGNTEWTILIDAGADIISFDAYQFGRTIGYYPEEVNRFLEEGGVLAWGIVPSSEATREETSRSLIERLKEYVSNLTAKGADGDLIWERCLVTPSCGTGALSVEVADQIFAHLRNVSHSLRQELMKAK